MPDALMFILVETPVEVGKVLNEVWEGRKMLFAGLSAAIVPMVQLVPVS